MENFASLARWIAEKSAQLPFGEIVIHITKHDGQVRQIERTVTERERPKIGGDR